ncbi:hypothetical protein [Bacteroides sp.]
MAGANRNRTGRTVEISITITAEGRTFTKELLDTPLTNEIRENILL